MSTKLHGCVNQFSATKKSFQQRNVMIHIYFFGDFFAAAFLAGAFLAAAFLAGAFFAAAFFAAFLTTFFPGTPRTLCVFRRVTNLATHGLDLAA
jgi:hypothetical protein